MRESGFLTSFALEIGYSFMPDIKHIMNFKTIKTNLTNTYTDGTKLICRFFCIVNNIEKIWFFWFCGFGSNQGSIFGFLNSGCKMIGLKS